MSAALDHVVENVNIEKCEHSSAVGEEFAAQNSHRGEKRGLRQEEA